MRFIQHPITLELVSADDYYSPRADGPMVMGDISPYRSMIDGSIIGSRSVHRNHLRQHGCIEVGNEIAALKKQVTHPKSPPGLKETLINVFNEKVR